MESNSVNIPPFEALFRNAAEGIVVTDQSGQIVLVNPAAEVIFGYNTEEMLGNRIEILIPESSRSMHERHRGNYHKDMHARSMGLGLELRAVRKDGTVFPVEVSLSPYEEDGRKFVIAFVIDITIRQRLIAAREEMLIELEREKEIGALRSRFVSIASHEFRNPLSTILSSASLITTYADRQELEGVKKHANRIKGAVSVLQSILGEFLSLGRIEDGKVAVHPESFTISTFLEELHEDMMLLAKAGQEMRFIPSGENVVFLDKNLLRALLVNLLSNAIKFSPENSTILLTADVRKNRCHISVIDQGMGIPADDQPKMFERFFRASNAYQTPGTGLGLFIVKKYIEMMQGTLDFTSVVGEGTTFVVDLPQHLEV